VQAVIVGCGRVGSNLARLLAERGDQVTVIDSQEHAFELAQQRLRLNESKVKMVLGTGVDEDLLRKAGVEHADVFVAVTNKDNTNIMAAQIARQVFKVKKVVCRIYDPARRIVYDELGIDSVCPTQEGAIQIKRFFEST
jgi:trk system potassium uptake protein TrkA